MVLLWHYMRLLLSGRLELGGRCVPKCRLDADPAFTTKADSADAVHRCVLAAYSRGEVEQPLVHEPQFRMQHGEFAPCLPV